jgi:ribA/ribD-fused uncharacterized protein
MSVDPRDLAGCADFDEVARLIAAGADLTVVEPRHAGLWRDPSRYPTAVTLVAMPSAGEVGILIVPFLDLVGEPGDPDFQYYAGIVYVLAVDETVFRFREYAQDEWSPYEAGLLGWATIRRVLDHHDWRLCPMIPYEDPLFVRAARLLWDRYSVRKLTVLIEGSGYVSVDTARLFSLDVRPAGGAGRAIRFYRVADRYGCFSNFAPYPVRLDRVRWPTTEHYFQAQKFADEEAREVIRKTPSPMEAAEHGRSHARALRADWEAVKVDVMREAVLGKFTQHPDLRRVLLATGDSDLVEHTRRDAFWGDGGDGRGQNILGQILMEVRARLRAEADALAETPEQIRRPLALLLEWFALGVPLSPTAWWRGELASRLEVLDRATLVEWLGRRLPRFAATRLMVQGPFERPPSGAGAYPGETWGGTLLGLVHAAGGLADDALVPALGAVLEAAWTGIVGAPAGARSVGSACVPLLARVPAGRARLEAVGSRVEEPALREQIRAALAGSG